MLSFSDCLDFLDMTEDELIEIAQYEHISLMCAIEECGCLLEQEEGICYLHNIFLSNFNHLYSNHHFEEALKCYKIYEGFALKHPLPLIIK